MNAKKAPSTRGNLSKHLGSMDQNVHQQQQPDNSEQQQQQQQETQKKDALFYLQKANRDAAHANEMADAANEALATQGEQIDRTDKKLDEAEANLKKADKVLKEMTWGGFFKSLIFGGTSSTKKDDNKAADTTAGSTNKSSGSSSGSSKEGKGTSAQPAKSSSALKDKDTLKAGDQHTAVTTQTKNELGYTQAENDAMDALEAQIAVLGMKGRAQHEEIVSQNKRLDALDNKIQATDAHTKKTNAKITKMLGK